MLPIAVHGLLLDNLVSGLAPAIAKHPVTSDPHPAWSLRPATRADQRAVTAVALAAGAAAWSPFLGRARIEAANRDSSHPADIVAVDDEGIFAFVAWDPATGEILRLYTHPRGAGRGAASALLEQALGALRAAGRSRAWLNTEERNEAARCFYERRGWREDGPPRVRDWYGTRLSEPTYVKDL